MTGPSFETESDEPEDDDGVDDALLGRGDDEDDLPEDDD
jgi:hypothetical protein